MCPEQDLADFHVRHLGCGLKISHSVHHETKVPYSFSLGESYKLSSRKRKPWGI